VLLGLGVTLCPLIAAVITAAARVDRLAEDYQQAVLRAEVATRQGRAVVEHLTEMQRAFGQYRVLGGDSFYRSYLDRRAGFRSAATQLDGLNLNDAVDADLVALLYEEQALFEVTSAGPEGLDNRDLGPEWGALVGRARAVQAVTSALIAIEATNGVDTAGELQRTLLLQAALVIPASLVLAGVFVVSMTRPIRSLSAAIRRLGSHDLSQAILVRGPGDIEDLGRQLDWLRRRILSLEQQKTRFIQHISHELKTPLTTLREGSELLAESLADSSPEDVEITRLMRTNSLHLQKLIEDLLRFGSTQESVAHLTLEDAVSLDGLVRNVIGAQAVAVNSKALKLDTKLARVRVVGDPSKLSVVVDNLLTNARSFRAGRQRPHCTRNSEINWSRSPDLPRSARSDTLRAARQLGNSRIRHILFLRPVRDGRYHRGIPE
jgi:two-component system sensor histidine kinase GlrK